MRKHAAFPLHLFAVLPLVIASGCSGMISSTDDPGDSSELSSADWTQIADEGESFTVGDATVVRFGIGSHWITKTLSGNGECTNQFFGSDPAFGRRKVCQSMNASAPVSGDVWQRIAGENESFDVGSSARTVRFGAGSSWIQKSVTGAGDCTNTYFGSDPAYGVVKECDVLVTSSTPPPAGSDDGGTTPPAPAPSPAPPPVGSAACASEPLRATGTVHYFCSVGGNDANDGLSSTSPKASWGAAWSTLNSMPAGDTVALCRGGSWTVSDPGAIRNKNCTASDTCDFRDYGSTASPLPVLTGGSGNAVFEMGWYQDYANSISGFRFFNLDVVNASTTYGVFLIWGGVRDMDVCNVNVSNAPGVVYSVTNSTTKRIAFHDSVYTHVAPAGQAFLFSCDDCSIVNNQFDYTGGSTNRDHPIYIGSNPEPCTSGCNAPEAKYVSSMSGPLTAGLIKGGSGTYSVTQRMRIANNTFKHSAQNQGVCVSTIIVVHEPHNGLVIENNLIEEPASPNSNGGCYGIGVGNGGDEPGFFTNLAIRSNKIFNAGNTNIAVENCQDCLIEDNVLANSYQTAMGIKVPVSLQSSGVGPNLLNARTTVRNNTVYYGPGATGASGLYPGAIFVGGEGSGYVVTNNAIDYNSTGTFDGFGCFHLDSALTAYTSLLGNACASLVADGGNYKSYLSAAPGFVNATTDSATANFSPATGSPLLGGGTSVSYAPKDIVGVVRSSSAPTIGAYEK